MKALKALVIGMGVLIVIGVSLVGYGLTRGKQAGLADDVAHQTLIATTLVKDGFFATKLPLPPGARLEQIAAAGDRVVLRVAGPEGEKLILLDSHTGQVAGSVTLTSDTH